jgi:hypothetical protein
MPFPARFRQPANITKYARETNPELWLNNYRLTCQLGGVDNDSFIIRNLSLFLADSARAWLEHLSARRIHNWADLVKVFMGNSQGTLSTLVIPRILGVAAKNRKRLFVSTFDASPGSAPSCPT